MGNKIKQVGAIIAAVIFCYLLLTVFMLVIVDFSSTANETITASSNWSDYPGTQGALVASPFWLYFIPGPIGMAAIVIVLRSK